MKKIVLMICVLLASTPLLAKSKSKQMDELLNGLFESNGPGGVALVVKDGKTVYRKAFGMANLELDVEMEPEHIFRIGSITKQFTAVATLKLAEEGKVDLNADITEYIKDYPTHGHKITVKHLLNHTSGIKSYTGMPQWTSETRKQDFELTELIDYFKNEPMDFAPGDDFRYNNSGYILLGHIIEVASGEKYADYIQNHIFTPLKMNSSSYGSTSRIIKNRASGYDKADEMYKNADFLSMTQPHAAGSLLSTVGDLHTWYQSVLNDEIISAESRKMAHTPETLNDGEVLDYGYGWGVGNIQGVPMIQHGGGINGFLSASLVLPEEKLFVAVLSNCNCNPPGTVANKLAALAIDKPYNWEKIDLSDEELQSYQAVYEQAKKGNEPENLRIITYEKGQLFSLRSGGTRYKIFPFDKDQFYFEDSLSTLEFNRNANGEIESVTMKSNRNDKSWQRTDKPMPTLTEVELSPDTFAKYIGKYELAPDFYIHIFNEGDVMYTQATGQQKIELIATDVNKFTLKGTDIKLTLNSNDAGEVNELVLHQNGNHSAKKVD